MSKTKQTTITVRLTVEEKRIIEQMAKFEGVSMSEIIKQKTFDSFEDEYDLKVYDEAYQEYLDSGKHTTSAEDYMNQLGISADDL